MRDPRDDSPPDVDAVDADPAAAGDGDPDGDAAGGAPGAAAVLAAVLDDAIAEFGAGDWADEVATARRAWDERRGRVFEDEALWELWAQCFLEWYVVERPVSRGDVAGVSPGTSPGTSPIGQLLARARAAGDVRRADAAAALLTSQRSLFEIRTLRSGRVELSDVLGGAAFSVAEPRALHGVTPGDVAELRLIGFEREVLFGRTFLFHPTGCGDGIAIQRDRITAAGGSRLDVIDACASLRVRCTRYRHVSAAQVYANTQVTPGRGAAGPDPGPRSEWS